MFDFDTLYIDNPINCFGLSYEPLAETHETTLPAPYIVEWRELQHIMW